MLEQISHVASPPVVLMPWNAVSKEHLSVAIVHRKSISLKTMTRTTVRTPEVRPHSLGTEQLTAVAAVVASFTEGEPDIAGQAAVPSLILHPVVSYHTTRLVHHTPTEHSTLHIPHIDSFVVPARKRSIRPFHFSTCDPCRLDFSLLVNNAANWSIEALANLVRFNSHFCVEGRPDVSMPYKQGCRQHQRSRYLD